MSRISAMTSIIDRCPAQAKFAAFAAPCLKWTVGSRGAKRQPENGIAEALAPGCPRTSATVLRT